MIITFAGRDWEWDQSAITVDEWRELKRKYRMSPKGFQDGVDEADADAYTFVYWTMLQQNGDMTQPLGDNLQFDLLALNHGIAAAITAETKRKAEEAEADPTPGDSRPDGTTPPSTDSSKKTSTKSGPSTSSPSPGSAASPNPSSDA